MLIRLEKEIGCALGLIIEHLAMLNKHAQHDQLLGTHLWLQSVTVFCIPVQIAPML